MPDSVLAMASSSTPAKRPLVGILLVISGIAWLLGIIVPSLLVASGFSWLAVIVAAALALAYLFLGLGRAVRLIPRVAFLIAFVGWGLFTLNDLHILDQYHHWAAIVALVGTLMSGIFVTVNHTFVRIADIVFLLASLALSLGLLQQVITPFLTSTAGTILEYVEAILLALAGILVVARR
jgi:hypothetical protein